MFILGSLESDFLLVLIELFSLRVTAEALGAKIDRKSAICKRVGHHSPNFCIEGDVPIHHFARIVRPMNALQLCR